MQSKWFNALKTLSVVVFVLAINNKFFAIAEEIPNEGSDDNLQIQDAEETELAKRAWKQLQGSWGKRNFDGITDEQLQRMIQNSQHEDYVESSKNFASAPSRFHGFNMIPDSDDFDESSPVEKRAWKSMSNAWGKRDWSKFRDNGWGKREPGNWNNLRGLWGKRSPQSWNKLSSAWGK